MDDAGQLAPVVRWDDDTPDKPELLVVTCPTCLALVLARNSDRHAATHAGSAS